MSEEQIDKLTIGLIRTFNSGVVHHWQPEEELIFWYGATAQPLSDALREVIREEVLRALRDGVDSTP